MLNPYFVDFEGIRVHYTSYGKGEEAVAMRPGCLSRNIFSLSGSIINLFYIRSRLNRDRASA
jgi:hypothetical protein